MAAPTAGSVVLLAFPFSDLSQSKLRPAVVLADAGRGDWVLCQVTSNAYGGPRAVVLTATDFASGGLRVIATRVRPSSSPPTKPVHLGGRSPAPGGLSAHRGRRCSGPVLTTF